MERPSRPEAQRSRSEATGEQRSEGARRVSRASTYWEGVGGKKIFIFSLVLPPNPDPFTQYHRLEEQVSASAKKYLSFLLLPCSQYRVPTPQISIIMSSKRKFTGPQRRIMKKARSDPYYSSPAAMRGARNAGARRAASFLNANATKYYDTALTGSGIAAPTDCTGGEQDPATVLCISAPARGDTEQERDGDRMIIKSAYVTGVVSVPAQTDQTAADVAGLVYVALVLDTQTNGAQLNSEDVFTNPSGSAVSAATMLRNLQFTTRFKVLSTAMLSLQQPTMVWDGTNIEQGGVVRRFRLSFKGDIPVQFLNTASSAGVAGVVNNSLHIIAFCDTGAGTTGPQISYNARVRFQG